MTDEAKAKATKGQGARGPAGASVKATKTSLKDSDRQACVIFRI